ncbi:UNVERIFIED_CONTAM: hypothetical protein RMT77_008034 [Armadillidium vulgare]
MSTTEKRLIRSKSGLKILPIKENKRSPFELSEPEWMKDNQTPCCLNCEANFDFVRRRHHCRRCGKIFCNNCCKKRMVLPRMCFLDPVRVCGACESVTLEEETFYKSDLKNLTTGVLLHVSDSSLETKATILHCSLSADHRNLMFSGTVSQTIPLINITSLSNMENSDNDDKDLNKLSFIINGENIVTQLQVPKDSPPGAQIFLRSLKKAFQMTEEAKPVIGTGN